MLNISLRQLRTLQAIRKHGKISVAARELGLTSPAVTLQLQQMEQELGSELFIRTRSGAVPTETGTIAIDYANRILDEMRGLEETLAARQGLAKGTLRLGVVSTGKYFAPRMIAAFGKAFSGIDVSLFAANRSAIISQLSEHAIDLALMGRPPGHFPVIASLFGDHPLVFIAHPAHPLAKRREIARAELRDQKFVVRERGSGTRSSFEYFMADERGDIPLNTTEMDSNETIKQAVMAGLGIAFISGHTIEQEAASGKLVVLDVEDTPIRRQWYSVRHAERTPAPAALAFEDFLRQTGPSLLPIIGKTYPLATFGSPAR